MSYPFSSPFEFSGFGLRFNRNGLNGVPAHGGALPQLQQDLTGVMQLLGSLTQMFGVPAPNQNDFFSYQQPFFGQQTPPTSRQPVPLRPRANTSVTTPPRTNPGNGNIGVTLVEVGVFEASRTFDEHAEMVRDVLTGTGRVNAANVRFQGVMDGVKGPEELQNGEARPVRTRQDLDRLIDEKGSDALNLMSQEIRQAMNEPQPPRVLNASMAYSRSIIYESVYGKFLNAKYDPALAREFGLRPDVLANDDRLRAEVVRYVDARLDAPNSVHRRALADYQALTRQAAQQGMVIVVAAGNEHSLMQDYPTARQGADFNFLGQSDHVISVAAVNQNGTPNNPADDTVAPFSSHGTGRFNPTIAANGVGIRTRYGVQEGTSFAAPQVSAVVADMLRQNPGLTYDQVVGILRGTATNTPAAVTAEGAGVLNGDRAVQEARRQRAA